jgi:GLPGLI family protein
MKVNYKLLFILTFFTAQLFLVGQTLLAQDSEPALAKIHYKFVHVNDTNERDKHHENEMVLYLGQHSSFYGTLSSELVSKQLKEQMNDPAFDGNLVLKKEGHTTPESYYTLPANRVLQLIYTLGGNRYLVEEEFPKLDWKIGSETREIGGYSCQKAEVRFKGRDYTAWFTPEIPFQAGPWKLSGLPGLILEAADSRNEVSFKYAGFDKLNENEFLVEIPKNTIKTNKKTLERQVDAFLKNPSAFVNAQAQGQGTGPASPMDALDISRIKSITVKKDGIQKSQITNNPIELERR